MTFPLPDRPKDKVTGGELSTDERTFILDSCLREKSRNDVKVIEFIDAFVRCKSISQASAECGIHHRLGYKIRHRKDVTQAIQKLSDKSAIKYGFDSSEIFERAKEIAEFDPLDLQNPDGSWKSNLHAMESNTRRGLKKLRVRNLFSKEKDMNGIDQNIIIGEVIDYEFWDKMKAVELVGKEKEMFKSTTKIEHGVTKDMALIKAKPTSDSLSLSFENIVLPLSGCS